MAGHGGPGAVGDGGAAEGAGAGPGQQGEEGGGLPGAAQREGLAQGNPTVRGAVQAAPFLVATPRLFCELQPFAQFFFST